LIIFKILRIIIILALLKKKNLINLIYNLKVKVLNDLAGKVIDNILFPIFILIGF